VNHGGDFEMVSTNVIMAVGDSCSLTFHSLYMLGLQIFQPLFLHNSTRDISFMNTAASSRHNGPLVPSILVSRLQNIPGM
jgi:hypothetical protein